METSSPPQPAIDLPAHLYYQLVYTLTDLLPPPLDDTPEALRTRNLAAIAKVAALLPVNANEADLAAQCIAARAQAEDILRLLRQHAGDIGLVIRLNAQYASMLRTSLSLHGRMMRVQALRQKREAIEGAANQDAWTLHIAERSMVGVVDPAAGPPQPAWPEAAPAPCADQRTEKHVSHQGTSSHDTAFETWLRAQMRQMREATGKSPSATHSSPANVRESPRPADYHRPIDAKTASTPSACSPMSPTAGPFPPRHTGQTFDMPG